MKHTLFFKYAGFIMILGGMSWFMHLYFSAEARMARHERAFSKQAKDIYVSHALNEEASSKLAMTLLTRRASDEIRDMLFPFLIVIHGCLFLLIHERNKAKKTTEAV